LTDKRDNRRPKINAGTDYIEKDKIIGRWKEYTEEHYIEDPNTSIELQEKNVHTGTIGDVKQSAESPVGSNWK
jgi:hypothetical protein